MLRLLLKLLSFVTGQRLLTPEQAASQQLELNDLRSKQTALESLSSKLRSEMKRQQALAREQLKETQKSHEQMLLAQQSEIDSLKEALGQLNLSVDIETQRQMKENNDLLSQLNWLSGTIAHDFRALLGFVAGAGVAFYHVWVLSNPAQTCGVDPLQNTLNALPWVQYWPDMFVADGLCTDEYPPLWGLSLPMWSGLGFLAQGLVLLIAVRTRQYVKGSW